MKAPAAVGVAAALLCGSCGKSPQQQAKNSAIAAHTNITVGLPPQTQTSRNPESAITGAEVWKVSGTNYSIQGTSLLSLGNGQTMFTVKVLCEFLPGTNDKPIARSIAKYAVDHGYVEANPVKAGLTPSPEHWSFSSAHDRSVQSLELGQPLQRGNKLPAC